MAVAHHQAWIFSTLAMPFLAAVVLSRGLPTVDPGLFVISGVGTCGGGGGYCLLGFDCTLDEDFVADDSNGHCEGLKSAFTPSAHFVCCKDTNRTSRPSVVTLPAVPAYPSMPDQKENEVDEALVKLVQSVAAVNVAVEMEMKNKRKPIDANKEEGKNGDDLMDTMDTKSEMMKPDKTEEEEEEEEEEAGKIGDANDSTTTENVVDQSTTTENELDATATSDTTGNVDESNSIMEQSSDVDKDDHEPSFKDNDDDGNKGEPTLKDNDDGEPTSKDDDNKEEVDSKDNWMAQASDEHSVYKSPWDDDDKNSNKHREWYTSTVEPPQDEANEVVESEKINIKSPQIVPTSFGTDVPDTQPETQTDFASTPIESETPSGTESSLYKTPGVKSHHDSKIDSVSTNSINSDQSQEIVVGNETEVTTELQTELPPCGMSARCISLVKFMYNNNVLCYGSPLYWNWTVTSASCALRIFRKGMFNVSVSPEGSESWSVGGNIRTIIVHESFRAVENPLHLEVNNIGLIRIYPGLGWNLCRSCLPRDDQEFQGDRCATHPLSQSNSRYYHRSSSDVCEGVTELLPGIGNFLALPCPSSSWAPRSTGSSSGTMGLPLRCDGVLAGVQASEGVGTRIYTPITPYLDWIDFNVRKVPVPRQAFGKR